VSLFLIAEARSANAGVDFKRSLAKSVLNGKLRMVCPDRRLLVRAGSPPLKVRRQRIELSATLWTISSPAFSRRFPLLQQTGGERQRVVFLVRDGRRTRWMSERCVMAWSRLPSFGN